MNNEDYIRKAVKLADGWSIDNYEDDDVSYDHLHNAGGVEWHLNEDPMWVHDIPEMFIDALAAQLVRQVDALDLFFVDSDSYGTAKVWAKGSGMGMGRIAKANYFGRRTMNTIKTIVDSAALEGQTDE